MVAPYRRHPDSYTSRYRGFRIQLEHPRPGVCVGKLFDPEHPGDRPELILDRSAKDVVDFAVRWIDGIHLERSRRPADGVP